MFRPLTEVMENIENSQLHLLCVFPVTCHGVFDSITLHGELKPAAGKGGFPVEEIFEHPRWPAGLIPIID
ncbi:hypothetical protein D3C75_1197410 [compost metagenome]